ncbi:DUF1826 domain-containing protein [Marinobacter salexigens]|uniref:DUF1826 domain-containing protein n=1 Tax=Marinobacter salexigens TaxID=1925763 RepID=A0ABS6ACG4_9GAMM|nr:DUF1826 domain-containing protein [Marinobacter salexigens]MBU2874549.1 DUF1826 domain-containing protein [Marinobacter salexigens]
MSGENTGLSLPIAVHGGIPECLTEIFRDEVNLAVWERPLSSESVSFAHQFSKEAGVFERFVGIELGDSVDQILPTWAQALPGAIPWLADVNEVVEMFGCLFKPAAIGVRLHVLPDTMCPRFHTDRVPVRLLVTYAGRGTEWLAENQVKRGASPGPLPDQTVSATDIQIMPTGAVSLLKGESWIGNEGRGLVHRSPEPGTSPRLILGLDWLS